ncbi:ribosomal RNA small subunit methyltransferase G [Hoyosella rhizosphaerae]|uniref:Ribosomal RNA small subunit methyltransferase G n=1 Tax=Hoyosella rhizosphaerae TaxID=1755582 RepID=A0A916XDM9_9ACTN|nr:ribosomal RNA small subunit methyltransferase G [Hoyosella rhizosphaerae]
MKQIPDHLLDAVSTIFGNRTNLAELYHEFLSTEGLTRGVIGPREVERLWDRHILNSAVIQSMIAEGSTVVDVGSGGGLPGIPLAIARPDLHVTLVEPMLRRTVFLAEFVEKSGLDVTVLRGRAEDKTIVQDAGGADVVTSRAVAPLLKLLRWSLPLVRPGGEVVAIKGASVQDEIDRDRKGFRSLGVSDVEIVQCGADVLDVPTTVVRIRKEQRQRSRHREQKRS